jgi:hypothetical protein
MRKALVIAVKTPVIYQDMDVKDGKDARRLCLTYQQHS